MKTHTILFVDDEENILSSLKRGLIGEPFLCKFATSGEAALKFFEEYEISVIVTDMRMPKMNGLELLKIIKEKYPDTVKIVLTGYIHLPQILATINQVDVFKFITKPWDMENEFLPIIYHSVEYYEFLMEKKKAREVLETRNISYQNMLNTITSKMKILEQKAHYMKSVTDAYSSETRKALNAKHNEWIALYFATFELFVKRHSAEMPILNPPKGNEFRKLMELYLERSQSDVLINAVWNINEEAYLNSSYKISYQIITTTIDAMREIKGIEQIELVFINNHETALRHITCSIKVCMYDEQVGIASFHLLLKLVSRIADKEHLLIDIWEDGIAIKI